MWGLKGCDCANPDFVQILVKCLPKYSVSYISMMIKSTVSSFTLFPEKQPLLLTTPGFGPDKTVHA